MYVSDMGERIVSLFSLFNVVDGKGEKFNQGELVRWLCESAWFPTNLLPGEKLQWTSIDAQTAKLIFNYKGLSLFCIVTFNDAGEITQVETKRYMGEEGKEKLETWIGKLTGYKEMNGIVVSTTVEALWKLEKGNYSYARFNVKKIEYNNPKIF